MVQVGVDQHEVEEVLADVVVQDPEVVADVVAVRLAVLRGDVADEDLERRRLLDGLDHPRDHQVGKDRRVERAGADDDQLGVHDRESRLRVEIDMVGLEEDPGDRRVLHGDL